jgi:purine-binding chemotaxis protein CheW
MNALLARDAGASGIEVVQLVAFMVGEQTYSVEITAVREIRAWKGATPLPNTRHYVLGVINLRGTIVPVLDLRARFGGARTVPTKTHVVVVLAVREKWIGLLVDAVRDILDIAPNAIRRVPEGTSSDAGLLTGLVAHEHGMVGILDLPAIVASDREWSQPVRAAPQAAG